MERVSPITKYREEHGLSLADFGRMFKPEVNKSTVLRWEERAPLKRCMEIERIAGIPRHELRPDIFGEPV